MTKQQKAIQEIKRIVLNRAGIKKATADIIAIAQTRRDLDDLKKEIK